MPTAICQIPAFSESPWRDRLETIIAQPTPDDWTVSWEAWVTPNAPNPENCQTLREARSTPGVTAYEAPPGKLSARNAAHDHAFDAGADVIVTWDADAPPVTMDALSNLLRALEDPQTVAANSKPVAPDTVTGRLTNVMKNVSKMVEPHLYGQASGFTATAWAEAGPFDTDRDQTDSAQVRIEEEFRFRWRVEELGDVVEVAAAPVFNDTRRTVCRVREMLSSISQRRVRDPYCDRLGVDTFQPHHLRAGRDDADCGCGTTPRRR